MKPGFERVCVIGLGYIGLPTAAVLASRGIEVIGVDVNPRVVSEINAGRAPVVEPDLEILVNGSVAVGKLRAKATPEPADAFIIAVPTPLTDAKRPDLTFVEAASEAIAPVLKKGDLIVVESTVPVGATESVSRTLAELRSDLSFPRRGDSQADVFVTHCPERVLPGKILRELVENDRAIGGISTVCAGRAAELYKVFVNGSCLLTDVRTAELVKLCENAYRDVNIAYANELSLVCDRLGIDVWEVIELANRHPRVKILNPGPGVGGHCIAVDPWFIVDCAPEETILISAARKVNDSKPRHVVNTIKREADAVPGCRIACLGLAYKANTDDLRESPAVEIVEGLADEYRGKIIVVEPNVGELPDSLNKRNNVILAPLEDAMAMADLIVVLVDHQDFSQISLAILDGKTVIDTRGLWRGHTLRARVAEVA